MLLSLISSIILLKSNNVYGGYDTQFHIKRIMELIDSNNHFELFPNFSFNYFHGSAVMTLYPYITLAPIILLSFFIKSKVMLVYGFFIINIFFVFIISFFSSKDYIKYYSTSYVFAIIYGMSNMLLNYNLIMTDLGIALSFVFLPLIIFGFLKMINGNGWIELSIGMSLLAISHILNLVIISVFLLLWIIINFKYLHKYIIINLLKSIILFFIISSIMWLPFLHFYILNFGTIRMPPSVQLNAISVKEFLKGLYGGKNSRTIGFFPIISIFVSIFFYKKFDRFIKQMYWFSLIIILFVLFLPWKIITSHGIFRILNQLQGIHRFYIIPQIFLMFIFALIFSKYLDSFKFRIIACTFIIFIALILQLVVGQYSFAKSASNDLPADVYLKQHNNIVRMSDNPYYKFNNNYQFNKLLNSYQDTNDDYIPKNAIPFSSYVNNNLGFYNNNHQIKVFRTKYNTFNFFGKGSINKLSLPIYAYNKEKLHVYLNNKIVNNYVNKNGLLTINNIQNNIKLNNKVYIVPSLDLFRIIGVILFISGWIFILGLVISRKFIN